MPHFRQPQSGLAPKFLAAAPRRTRHRRNKEKIRHGTKTTIEISSLSKRGAPEHGDIYLLDSETYIAQIETSSTHPLLRQAFLG